MQGIIAIVGRPNVGKSALFNRIIRKRIAIVHDQPGVTRDRVMAEAEWRGVPYTLIDTGGIGLSRGEKAENVIQNAALEQVQLAIDSAHVIILVVNIQEGVVPLDREVATRLRQSGKPILVAANKADNYVKEAGVDEFSQLGFDKIIPVSAIHGTGIEQLTDDAFDLLPPESRQARSPAEEGASPEEPLKLAIVGRPNVGKSSIINALTRSVRVIVSPIPGTTRDAVDVPFEIETEGVRMPCLLIDTAGMRKTRSVDDTIEFFSVKRSEESIARCDITILVLDAENGIFEQDKKIADTIVRERKACIVVINKWDLVAEDVQKARLEIVAKESLDKHRKNPKVLSTLGEFGQWVQEKLFFLDYAPVIFTSAKSGFHLDRLLEAVRFVAGQLKQQVPTAVLNRTLHDAVEARQPVTAQGTRLKFYYATQVKQAPPTFLLFVNRSDLLFDPYKHYLCDQMRKAFGYEGCPIGLVPRSRPKTIEPKRKARNVTRQPNRPIVRERR